MSPSGNIIKNFLQNDKCSPITLIALLLVIVISVVRVVGDGDIKKGRGVEAKGTPAIEKVVFFDGETQKCVSVRKLETTPEYENGILISLRNVIASYSGLPACKS